MGDPVSTAIFGSAVIGAGASLFAGDEASDAASDAAKAQQKAADAASQAQLEMYYQSRKDLAPWRKAGKEALGTIQNMLAAGPGEFKESPDYQFVRQQGLQAMENMASGRMGVRSGAHMRAAGEYATGLASGEYDKFLSRYYQKLAPYMSVAGVGLNAVSQGAQNAMTTGGALAQNALYSGQAQAAGYINQANAMTGMVTGIGNAATTGVNQYLYYKS